MPLSRITSTGIQDGTIATADLADNAVNSAKIGADVIVAEDLANNAITTAEITDGAGYDGKIKFWYLTRCWILYCKRWFCQR